MAETTQTQGKSGGVAEQFSPGRLADLDGRLGLTQDMRRRYSEVCNDLGGVAGLSYMQRSLIERALWLEYWLASRERDLASGADFDVGKWVQAANSLQGIYSKLGLQRRAKHVTDLQEYLRQREAAT